jgi:hypothetical protein
MLNLMYYIKNLIEVPPAHTKYPKNFRYLRGGYSLGYLLLNLLVT